jgi:exodeoxyribonuclease V
MPSYSPSKSWDSLASLDPSSILTHIRHEATGDQSLAAASLIEFLIDPDSTKAYILRGYAGTGKTTLIGALVSMLEERKFKTVLLAPTGRAAKVLGSSSQRPASTIHHEIYLLRTRSDGTPYLSRKPNRYRYALFIIDEASMIPGKPNDDSFKSPSEKSLLEDLLWYVGTGHECKVLFVGDHAQLPPVGLLQSPALDAKYLKMAFDTFCYQSELTEVVRQVSDSGILFNATGIRKRIQTGQYRLPLFRVPFPDVQRIGGEDLEDALLSTMGRNPEEAVLITRSNKRANLFNQEIRRRILGRSDELAKGDLLMVVRNNYFWLEDNDDEGFIANGDIVELERIFGYEQKYGFNFADVQIRFLDYSGHKSLNVKLCIDPIDAEAPSLTFEEHKRMFGNILEDYSDLGSRKAMTEAVRNDPYYNALQVKFAYSLTCHKTQGGQWKHVFLEQGFFREDMLEEELFRWLYTAVTRATGKLYLLNFRDSFFEESEN